MSRITITLPAELLDGVDALAEKLSVSRSALLVQLLTPSVTQLVTLLPHLPTASSDDTPELQRRLRGKSTVLISDAVSDAMDVLHALHVSDATGGSDDV
jgi:hypothetical protein